MPGTQDLSFAFLETHPVDAARVLERIPPQDVAALLAEAPARLTAPVMRAMLPLHTARCLENLADDAASGLLRAMGPQAGVATLHYVPEARRNTLLAQLPTALALAFRLLLGYPEDTVGAWMNPRVLVMPADATAEAAIKQLRNEDVDEYRDGDAGIFVIGATQQLLGQVSLRDLLRAPADARLSKIMHKVKYTLPARTAIHAVEEHAGWTDHQMLAVVEREDHFVGALDRAMLGRALQRTRRIQPDTGYGDMVADAANGYWLGVASLIQLVVALLPVARAQSTGAADES